ncbi:aldehyde dehydrogenase family protein [Qaidamihabitans albus]|uniref:aldehyde dehydrogenase family protein n=1 Tax=Qaidamihabitans albus TaxID=2795733 RepID=UPI0018F1B242|nr:aldehyde dehydrogenase family protein [Qaidamihabitans albus]
MTTTSRPAKQDRLRADVRDLLGRVGPFLVDGEWVHALDGSTLGTVDPSDGTTLATVAAAEGRDVDRAVAAARRALSGPWSRLTPARRGTLIWRLADLLEERAEEFAQLESLDQGKPQAAALAADVPLAAGQLRYMAGWADKISGRTATLSVPYTPARTTTPIPAGNRSAWSAPSSRGTSRSTWPRGSSLPRWPQAARSCSNRPSRHR